MNNLFNRPPPFRAIPRLLGTLLLICALEARAQLQSVHVFSESEGGIELEGVPQMSNGGKVAFLGSRRVGGERIYGAYAGFAGGVTVIAEESSAVPGFEEISGVAISSSGTVGFGALARTPREDDPTRTNANGGVFTTNDPYENIGGIRALVGINDNKENVGQLSTNGLAYAGRGGSYTVVGSQFLPQQDRYVPRAVINNQSQVACIVRPGGSSLLEVRRADVPSAGGPLQVATLASGFESIDSLDLDDSGRAVFIGRLPDGTTGIYASSGAGGVTALAISVENGPGFRGFGAVAVSAGGQIAFTATYTAPDGRSRSGIFKGFGGLSDKVAADGDPVTVDGFAGTLSVGGFWPRCVDDSGQVLFGGTVSPPDHDDDGGGGAGPASVRPSSHVPSRSGLFLTRGTPNPPDDEPPGDDEDDDPDNTHTWINDAGGAFATASNWSPAQVPVRNSERADSARFNLGAAYTVNTPEAATERLLVRGGDVTLNVGLYAVGSSDSNTPSVSITRSGILRVTGGTLQSVNTAIGNGALTSDQVAEAHVFNTGTTWTNPGQMTIGGFSQGRLFVANGPTLTTGEARIGVDARGEAIVGGAGSMWDAGSLAVGYSGEGELAVEAGAHLSAEILHIGLTNGDGLVTVDGVPSRLTVTESFDSFQVGRAGGFGELQVIAGGLVEASRGAFLAVGLRDGNSIGTGRVLVRGSDPLSGARSTLRTGPPGSLLPGNLFLGWGGDGLLRIEDGGLVQCATAVVADLEGAIGVAVVEGRGGGNDSHWEIADELFVGFQGSGKLEINGGGLVSAAALLSAGTSGSSGRIIVSGVGSEGVPSRLFVEESFLDFVIGRDAGEGELTVTNGGWVNAPLGGFLAIGGRAAGGSSQGVGRVFVRGFDAASGARSKITLVPFGPGLQGQLLVGWGGDGALRIEDGGLVQCESAVVADQAAAVGLVEVVASGGGAPSHLNIGAELYVGLGSAGQIAIEAGGLVTSKGVVIGSAPGGRGTIAVRGVSSVDGSPSTLQFGGSAAFILGADGGSGELVVQSGARVTTPEGTGVVLRSGEIRVQGTDPVSGSRSALFLEHPDAGRGALDVYEGAAVTITEGGTVRCRTARIGGLGTEVGAALVDIAGTGALGPSRWHASVSLTVGAGLTPGSTGVLSVFDGGAVTIGDAEPQAHWVRIGTGGTLSGNGTIVAPGLVGVVGGVDNFAGTVSPGSSPGSLTIDGDYTQGATGTLAIEIGGLGSGFDHDRLVVTGGATFEPGAKIRITLLDPNPDDTVNELFIPQTGETFEFLAASSVNLPAGETLNDIVEFTNLPAGVSLDFSFVTQDGVTRVMAAATSTLPPPAGPRITVHPRSTNSTAGSPTTLVVESTGVVTPTHQWFYNGLPIPGATGASYTVPITQTSHAGDYSVVVTGDGIAATSRSGRVNVSTPPSGTGRLLSLSTRAQVLTGDDVLIPGFVIAGSQTKRLLIRAIGPTLGQTPFNIGGVLEDPRMQLLRWNTNTQQYDPLLQNDNWRDNANADEIAAVSAQLFAFGINDDREAILLADLTPGQYTVITDGVDGNPGIAIVELYDADPLSTNSRLLSISNRGFAGDGDQVMIPGFVVSESGPKTFLVRVIGPTLEAFSVTGAMQDPELTVFNGSTPIVANDNWSDSQDAATTAQIAEQIFAFALPPGSKDAATVVTLPPGIYTVVGSSALPGATGVILMEIYIVE